jgi:1-acyl-sn-glycerol-3-phosphate acyltransferase
VIPALLTGTRAVWPKGRFWPTPWGRITLTFGPPLRYADAVPRAGEDPDDAFGRVLMERIAALKDSPDPVLPFWAGLRATLTY